jgi:hypothetical protein
LVIRAEDIWPNINVTWKPRTDGVIEGIVQVSPNNESHPGLAHVHLERLLKAREMGFNVLAMINFGTVRSPEIPQDMLATVESGEAYWEYANRSGECSEFIEKMGCGRYDYDNVKKAKLKISDNQYADADRRLSKPPFLIPSAKLSPAYHKHQIS